MTDQPADPVEVALMLAGPQLLLVLIMVGCMGVLAYRQHPD